MWKNDKTYQKRVRRMKLGISGYSSAREMEPAMVDALGGEEEVNLRIKEMQLS